MALYRRLSLTVKFVLVVSLVIIVIFFFSLVANLLNLRSVSISNGELEGGSCWAKLCGNYSEYSDRHRVGSQGIHRSTG